MAKEPDKPSEVSQEESQASGNSIRARGISRRSTIVGGAAASLAFALGWRGAFADGDAHDPDAILPLEPPPEGVPPGLVPESMVPPETKNSPPSLKDLAIKKGKQVGMTTDGPGKSYWDSKFRQIIAENFNLMIVGGYLSPQDIAKYGYNLPINWSNFAKSSGAGYRIDHVYWGLYHDPNVWWVGEDPINNYRRGESIPERERVLGWMRERAKSLFTNIPYFSDVVVVNEPFWGLHQDRQGWQPNPFYRVLGEDWLKEAFKIAIEELLAVGKTPGRDVRIILDELIEVPGVGADFAMEKIWKMKNDLVKDGYNYPIDLGLQYHIVTIPLEQVKTGWGPNVSRINEETLTPHLRRLGEFGKLHFTEISMATTGDRDLQATTMTKLIKAGEVSGVVSSYGWWYEADAEMSQVLFDRLGQPLPGLHAVMDVLAS